MFTGAPNTESDIKDLVKNQFNTTLQMNLTELECDLSSVVTLNIGTPEAMA